MLSNADLVAKVRFDTAENEPAKKLQNFAILAPSSGSGSQPEGVTAVPSCEPAVAAPAALEFAAALIHTPAPS